MLFLVPSQFALHGETLAALQAGERPFAGMRPDVGLQFAVAPELFVALRAGVRLGRFSWQALMLQDVLFEHLLPNECLRALGALVSLSRMQTHVFLQRMLLLE